MKSENWIHVFYITFCLVLSVLWYHQGYEMGRLDANLKHHEEMKELRKNLDGVLRQSERLLENEKKIGDVIGKTDKLLQDMLEKQNADPGIPVRPIH